MNTALEVSVEQFLWARPTNRRFHFEGKFNRRLDRNLGGSDFSRCL
jgi:hypothetical protein